MNKEQLIKLIWKHYYGYNDDPAKISARELENVTVDGAFDIDALCKELLPIINKVLDKQEEFKVGDEVWIKEGMTNNIIDEPEYYIEKYNVIGIGKGGVFIDDFPINFMESKYLFKTEQEAEQSIKGVE